MSVIFGVLEEERRRLEALKAIHEKRLKALPKGSIRIRPRGMKKYAYLLYRDGKRVRTLYVGEAGSLKLKAMREQLAERKKTLEAVRRVKSDLRILEKVGRARRKK